MGLWIKLERNASRGKESKSRGRERSTMNRRKNIEKEKNGLTPAPIPSGFGPPNLGPHWQHVTTTPTGAHVPARLRWGRVLGQISGWTGCGGEGHAWERDKEGWMRREWPSGDGDAEMGVAALWVRDGGSSSSPVEGEAARGDVQGTKEVPNPVGAEGYTRAP
jgi:hypothetical protein